MIEPAFPYQHNPAHGGMSLRDYFAAKALAAMAGTHGGRAFDPHGTAKAAYEFADAMMEARDNQ